jgi:hypothetical protein
LWFPKFGKFSQNLGFYKNAHMKNKNVELVPI